MLTAQVSARYTSLVLTAGTVISAVCFLVSIGLELLGRVPGQLDVISLSSIAWALLELRPEGWASAGVVVVIATPAISLVATAVEYRGRFEAWLALAVLLVLALSLALAVLR